LSTKCLFWALRASVGNPNRKLILITLADIANEKMECWPSHQYIAERSECDRRTVIRHLKELEKSKLIKIIHRSDADGLKTSNVYVLGCVTESHLDVSKCHKGSVTESHNTITDTPIGINGAAWDEWVSFRTKKKKISDDARKKQWKLLEQYNHDDQQKIIDLSIQNDWQGLFPLKGGNNGKVSGTVSKGSGNESALTVADKLRARLATMQQPGT
jgi:DNA-binding transcriptional MocR family regulator